MSYLCPFATVVYHQYANAPRIPAEARFTAKAVLQQPDAPNETNMKRIIRSTSSTAALLLAAPLLASSLTAPRIALAAGWTMPSIQGFASSVGGYSTVPINPAQAAQVGSSLDVIQQLNPALATAIGTALGAIAPGASTPAGPASVDVASIVEGDQGKTKAVIEGARDVGGATVPPAIGIDFTERLNAADLALTLIHELDHLAHIDPATGKDPRVDPVAIALATGAPIELAKLMAECAHAEIEYAASTILCNEPDWPDCAPAGDACAALQDSDTIGDAMLKNCNGITLLSGFWDHPDATAAEGEANDAQAASTDALLCPACVKWFSEACQQ